MLPKMLPSLVNAVFEICVHTKLRIRVAATIPWDNGDLLDAFRKVLITTVKDFNSYKVELSCNLQNAQHRRRIKLSLILVHFTLVHDDRQ